MRTKKKTLIKKKSKAKNSKKKSSLRRPKGSVTSALRFVRFIGVSLGGGKTDRTALSIVDYYPDKKRLFLRSLQDKVSSKGESLGDDQLLDILEGEGKVQSIAFDVPLQLPKCLRCELKCPGMLNCTVDAVVWMRKAYQKRNRIKRPNKMFTPYTERVSEIYIANELEEPFHPSHALGANAAPLTARAHYLGRRLKKSQTILEVYPKLSLWRIGMDLNIPKSHLRFHRHAVDSDESRHLILQTLVEKGIAFIYQQDLRLLIDNSTAFDSFLCALTGFLKFRKQTEEKPAGYPQGEVWIDFPVKKIIWF